MRSLLDELLETRDYWLAPVSPSGNSNHPDFKIIMVKKGWNRPEVEAKMLEMEREMIAILREL